MKFLVEIEGRSFEVEVLNPSGRASVDGEQYSIDMRSVDGHCLYSLIVDNCPYDAFVEEKNGGYSVTIQGEQFEVEIKDPKSARMVMMTRKPEVPGAELPIRAPLPGLVVAVEAEPGRAVKKSQVLVVLEAMKMENDLSAPRDGIVREVKAAVGEKVEKGQVLLTLE